MAHNRIAAATKSIRYETVSSLQALQNLQRIKESRVTVAQPPHRLVEVGAVIVRLDPGRARQAVSLLHALEFSVVIDVEIYQKACELSASLKQHVFDTLYHAVALTEPERYLCPPMSSIVGRPTGSDRSVERV